MFSFRAAGLFAGGVFYSPAVAPVIYSRRIKHSKTKGLAVDMQSFTRTPPSSPRLIRSVFREPEKPRPSSAETDGEWVHRSGSPCECA